MAGTIMLSSLTVPEHPEVGTVIGTLSVAGGKANETFSYTLTNDADGRVEIKLNTTTGLYELVVKNADSALFDYEAGQFTFDIAITATSDASGGSATVVDPASLTLSLIDNVAPTDITLSNYTVTEHVANGTVVGDLLAADSDPNESFTFELTGDAEGRFDIVNGKLVVEDGSKLDFLTAKTHDVTVKVTDIDGNVFEKTITINVGDAFDFRNGTEKNNWLYGGAGADMIKGLGGNDKLFGLGGDDVLSGGTGKDMLYGGEGKDTFVLDSAVKKGHFDHIMDFKSADDTIRISLSALKAYKVKVAKQEVYEWLAGTNEGKKKGFFSLDKVFDKGKIEKQFFTLGGAKDSYDFITYDRKNGFVYLDLDGAGAGKGFAIAKLKPGTYVQADDFVFV